MDSTHATHLLLVVASVFNETRAKPGEASLSCGRTLRGGTGASPEHSTSVKGLSHHHTSCVCGTVGHDHGQCTKES